MIAVMKIKYTEKYSSAKPDACGVVDTVSDSIIHNYREGVAEAADEKAGNCATALGRLVNILASKGILNAEEVLNVAGISYTGEPELLP